MSDVKESFVTVGGCRCRVWEKGQGPTLAFLAGLRGVPRWRPFFDRLAERYRVVVPSLPGYPGAEPGHVEIDEPIDWITTTLDLLDASGLAGADVIGESVGGMLAAEVAALSRGSVGRLVLIDSFGLYDAAEPVRNPFQRAALDVPAALTADVGAYLRDLGSTSTDPAELADWEVLLYRADEAATRLIWPFGERGLRKRLHRIQAPTLVLWGERDALIPASYATRFASAIPNAEAKVIAGAGHLATIDAPDAVAAAIAGWASSS